MSFQTYQLLVHGPMAPATKTGTAPVRATLTTDESPTAVEAAGYFNSAAARLPKGSHVDATMLHATAPVRAGYVITSNDGTTVVAARETDDEEVGAAREVIPTADGLTTGLLLASDAVVNVTSANANHWLTLPAIADVAIGKEIWGLVGATACEIRTPATSNTLINGTDGDSAESVLAAGSTFMAKKMSATAWTLLTVAPGAVAAPVPD